MANDLEKQAAARASLEYIHDGQVLGLGTGSTAAFFIEFLGEKVKSGLKVRGIPTSIHSQQLAEKYGIPLTTFEEVEQVDVDIDGADEFDPQLNLIKGGGGALLREKIVASASRKFVVVSDASKQVPILGRFPLPVEIIPFAQSLLTREITAMGAAVSLRKAKDGTPYRTDEAHHILDCAFGQIPDPAALANSLANMPGVVEHGLFIGMADVVLIGKGSEVIELRKSDS